jgi:hypothetical protein
MDINYPPGALDLDEPLTDDDVTMALDKEKHVPGKSLEVVTKEAVTKLGEHIKQVSGNTIGPSADTGAGIGQTLSSDDSDGDDEVGGCKNVHPQARLTF